MRVALVSQEYPPETAKGGIGTQTFQKAHGLAALGHDVHVISRSPTSQRSEKIADGVHVTRLPGGESRMPIYTEVADWLSYSTSVAAELAALHAAKPLDLVDCPEWGAEGYVHLLNRNAWDPVTTVIHLHGPLVMFAHEMGWPAIDSEFFRTGTMMEGTCVRLADAVFSSSACSADWCAKHYGLQRAAIPVLHTGIDIRLFSPQPVAKAERPTIVFAGKLVQNKGVHLLVDAACHLAREFPALHLRLLGRGAPRVIEELQGRAHAAGLPHLLDTPGFVDRSELPAHFSQAHVFAAPSQYEGGPGFVYLEAMACGLPVIACEGSGAAEVVTPGETGYLTPPNDVGALTLALRRLLQDGALRRQLGDRARQYCVQNADQVACIQRIEAFYAEVAGRREGATLATQTPARPPGSALDGRDAMTAAQPQITDA